MTDATPDPLHFTPVPHTRRARGWTADAQHAFIDALSHCGVVAQAARSVGCSARSAYQLRQRPGADSFAAAWDWAMDMGLDEQRARAVALINGDRKQALYRGGRLHGYRIAPDRRVMFAALRALAGDTHGLRAAMPHHARIAARERAEQPATEGDRSGFPDPAWPVDPLLAAPPTPPADAPPHAPPHRVHPRARLL